MSSRLRANTGQKRSSEPYRIVYWPIPLPEAFPLVCHGLHMQGDEVITYLHGHNCLEIGYCHEGAGVFVVGGKVLPFQARAVSFITPVEFHLARSVEGTQSKWTWLYLDPVRLLSMAEGDPDFSGLRNLSGRSFGNILTPEQDALLGDLVLGIIEELQKQARGHQSAIRGLVRTLLVRIQRQAPIRRRKSDPPVHPAIHRVAPALEDMAARYPDEVGLAEWARSCHVSVPHFRRLFRQALGKAPYQYLTELRVRMAATRLHATDDKIVVIAQEVGFPTLSSFNRAFRMAMKITPRQWRARAMAKKLA